MITGTVICKTDKLVKLLKGLKEMDKDFDLFYNIEISSIDNQRLLITIKTLGGNRNND